MTADAAEAFPIGFIDTHSHLQVERLDAERPQLMRAAKTAGVESMLLCAGAPEDWERTHPPFMDRRRRGYKD